MLNPRAMLASMNFVGGAMTPSLVFTHENGIYVRFGNGLAQMQRDLINEQTDPLSFLVPVITQGEDPRKSPKQSGSNYRG